MGRIFKRALEANMAAYLCTVDEDDYLLYDGQKVSSDDLKMKFKQGMIIETSTGLTIPTDYTDAESYSSVTYGTSTAYSKEYTA